MSYKNRINKKPSESRELKLAITSTKLNAFNASALPSYFYKYDQKQIQISQKIKRESRSSTRITYGQINTMATAKTPNGIKTNQNMKCGN